MDNKSPFSLYDFLGYFIPGAVFFYLFTITISAHEWVILKEIQKTAIFERTIAFIIFSYVFGHVFNYLSSITIERYSIWSIGYPSRFILGINPAGYFRKSEKKLDFSKIWRLALFLLLFPVSIIDYIIGKKAGFRLYYTNQLDDSLKANIEKRIDLFKEKLNLTNSNEGDFFRPIWHYYYEKCEAHRVKFDNYVALYGFTRSMSFVFCMFGWLFLFAIPFRLHLWCVLITACLLSSVLSYIFYIAFLKFYRRFTLEGFMCMVIDTDFSNSNSAKSKSES